MVEYHKILETSQSMDWFLWDRGFRHERVKLINFRMLVLAINLHIAHLWKWFVAKYKISELAKYFLSKINPLKGVISRAVPVKAEKLQDETLYIIRLLICFWSGCSHFQSTFFYQLSFFSYISLFFFFLFTAAGIQHKLII